MSRRKKKPAYNPRALAKKELRDSVKSVYKLLVIFEEQMKILAERIDKEREVADKLNRLENVKLSPDFDYYALNSLTMEAREKLTKHKPQTLGQASRISGISPADISVIAVFLGR